MLVYCKRWNFKLQKPALDKVMNPGEAGALHARGQPYTVAAVSEDGRAKRVVDTALHNGYVRVHFLDEFGRVEVCYYFGPQGDLLFLDESVVYTYPDVPGYLGLFQAERVERERYRVDGTGLRTVDDEVADETYQQELWAAPGTTFDRYWEPVPAFGHYDSVARIDREAPPLPFR